MRVDKTAGSTRWLFWAVLLSALFIPILSIAQPVQPTTEPLAPSRDVAASAELKGRKVEGVRVVGNTQTSTAVILNQVRTKEGEPFDPATAVEDYQRIYSHIKTFASVEARVEPTATGVIVTFVVTEQKQVNEIRYRGNANILTADLHDIVDVKTGQAIDRFRINISRQAIEQFYHTRNYPFAHVSVSEEEIGKTGVVTFDIVEGPQVRVRKVDFSGNDSFSNWRLKDEIKTAFYIPIFRPGTYDAEQVEADVNSIRKFYDSKGFADVRVGANLTFSADQSDLMVTFVIDEGPRYQIDHLIFQGNSAVSEAQLRKGLNLVEGQYFDQEVLDRDNREIIKSYSPYGFIYDPESDGVVNPDYLQVKNTKVYKEQKGHLDLVYEISEGKTFTFGRFLVKGNDKTQEKVVLRELHVTPGQKYNSAEIQDAQDRLRGTPYFSNVTITPIGDDPLVRDVLIEVNEQRTASISAGVGINSNGGVGGNISYEQKDFDAFNVPLTIGDFLSDRAFTGAGQDFRASFEPGSVATNASISFSEPYLFDQPYSFSSTAYLRDREREDYDDRRLGARISFGKRFDYVYSAAFSLSAEDVKIQHINDVAERAQEILDGKGHHTLTSVGLQFRRDTTNHGPLIYKGDDAVVGIEQYGGLGGQVDFTRLTFSIDNYQSLGEDLLDRHTVLNLHGDFGYDLRKAPFYERFYGGGIGSIRGFEYRGVSPRAGTNDDRIGGDFSLTGGAEIGFPLAADVLRGVVFIDAGDVESDFRLGEIRSAAGFGFRLVIPFFGQIPLALDFGFPITKSKKDDAQIISFSLGVSR